MYKTIKRFLDISFSLLLIVLLSPIFILTIALVIIFMGMPVFFTQQRVGFKNKEFRIFKFRTMKLYDENRSKDFERITRFGRFLRVTRIDELPQLVNILKGDMSFIGPRPLLPEYLPYYTKIELCRHKVRPGLSGLSQISASYPTWETQFEYDVEYVDNMSFMLDFHILLKTIRKVLMPSKSLRSGVAGREKFDVYRKIT